MLAVDVKHRAYNSESFQAEFQPIYGKLLFAADDGLSSIEIPETKNRLVLEYLKEQGFAVKLKINKEVKTLVISFLKEPDKDEK